MFTKFFIKISLVFFSSLCIVLGCSFSEKDPKSKSNNYLTREKVSSHDEKWAKEQAYNEFHASTEKLSFIHLKDWVCREVIYGERVDCYPDIRLYQQYFPPGFDQKTVPRPEISILIERCNAVENSKSIPPLFQSNRFTKDYDGCKVFVYAIAERFKAEEELDAVILNKENANNILTKEINLIAKIKAEKIWATYVNKEYGFKIDYPTDLDGEPLKITEEDGKFFIKNNDAADRPFKMPFSVGLEIKSEDDLESFLKKEYYEGCKLDGVQYEKPLAPDLYPFFIQGTDGYGNCFINWMAFLLYSPGKQKAVAINIGQESPLIDYSKEIPVDYIHETIESFRFN